METIVSKKDAKRKAVLYFAINETNMSQPFLLGGYTDDPNLPPIAQTGGVTSFGLSDLDNATGPGGLSWRQFLQEIDCSWGISILEKAKKKNSVQFAIKALKSKKG